ncbi:transmembrane protein [Platysternon megacephalum]|uniref:Transmembrane protein n=1 Tax=Platysternon megacephalum TaxID=55544 RepID=A0A4D9F9L0_9SAUR|nr:transmembrane protein [Platysternon megacephalum]
MSLPILPTPQGPLPTKVTGGGREQGAVSSTMALSRGKPSMVPIQRSPAHHRSPGPRHCPETDAGTAPPWSSEESSSESEGESFAPSKSYRYLTYSLDFGTSPLASAWPLANAVAVLELVGVSLGTRPPFPPLILSGVQEVNHRFVCLAPDPDSGTNPSVDVQEMAPMDVVQV